MNKEKSNDSCTSFCLKSDGYAILGANYDHGKVHDGMIFTNQRGVIKSYWENDPNSEHIKWTSRYGSVTFNLVMNQFAWGGMNEAGLVISTMELAGSRCPAPDKRPWIYANYWVQYVLDNFAAVEEVIASRKLISIKDYVDHYLVCDRTGNCVAIEFLDGKEIYHTGKNLPMKVLANNSYAESISAYYQKIQGRSVIENPMLLRFIKAAERVEEFNTTPSNSAVEYAFDVLDEVCGQKMKGSPTHWSIVYDTKKLQVSFRTRIHSDIRSINFKNLDFSRKSSVKMLDIHEKLSGDITKDLQDYSTEYHLQHALNAGRKWGSDPRMIEQEIKYVEGFL